MCKLVLALAVASENNNVEKSKPKQNRHWFNDEEDSHMKLEDQKRMWTNDKNDNSEQQNGRVP